MTLRSRTVDAVFGALELMASLYSWVSKLRRQNPVDITEPIPLRRQKPLPRPPRVPRI